MRIPRYRLGAPWYDTVSLEALLYRGGRRTAVQLAAPGPGDRVLDVGCGTGLTFADLVDAVGRSGSVTAIDSSAAMLRQAAARVARHHWPVHLVRADASVLGTLDDASADVVVFCYSLSIVPDWEQVWRQALRVVAPGGRIAVVDTDYPTGWRRILDPLVWVFLTAGGVHPRRRVWTAVARDLDVIGERTLMAGHVRLAVGSARVRGRTSP